MSDQPFPIVKPFLKTLSLYPENQEAPIEFIQTDTLDARLFFRRNHFSYPSLSYSNYWLPLGGSVKTPLLLSTQDLLRLPSKTLKVVLECAGDKRSFFETKVFGEQWENGAISQGIWKGISLRSLLERAGVREEAKEVIIEGYDYGERKDFDQVFTYSRSLPIEKALHSDTIIAYEYNHKPIPFKHGYPLRLIVPQWYGMASVKWIKQITVIDSHFTGPFQTVDYVYYPNKENNNEAFPVTTIHVNSTIQKPLNRDTLNTGTHEIKGIAWTGKGRVIKVEISTDNGKTWIEAEITADQSRYAWTSWSFQWTVAEKGEYTIMSRATDSYQRIQPSNPFWNRKGYGYNAIDKVMVKIE